MYVTPTPALHPTPAQEFALDVADFANDWLANPAPADPNHPITRIGRATFYQRALFAIAAGTPAMEQFAVDYMHLGQS